MIRTSALPGCLLQRQGEQVAEAAFRERVLVGEEPVVGVHGQLVPLAHGLGQEETAELSDYAGDHRDAEEDPDVRAVA